MENEKCPVCQKNAAHIKYIGGEHCLYCEHCHFQCDDKALPHISAAMDLARARSAYAHAPCLGDEETQELWDNVTATTMRVLEVFGGE